MNSDSTNTDFSKKCEILDELWMSYRDEEPMQDFMEYNDLALPLAFAINEGIVEETKQAKAYIEEAWLMLCDFLKIDSNQDYESLDEMMQSSQYMEEDDD